VDGTITAIHAGDLGPFSAAHFPKHPVNFRLLTKVIAALGFLFALGSKLAIRAAEDEIDEIRARYLCLYPTTIAPVVHPLGIG
jgi:hypothetical protein